MTLPSSIFEAARGLREGAFTAADLAREVLDAAERLEPTLHAFSVIDAESALSAAQAADDELAADRDRGVLHGIPLAVKDIIDIRGLPTRCGSPAYVEARPAPQDAPVAARLRNAGAVLVGKATAHELACGVFSAPAANPWDPSRAPGGSSGGSAVAVAAGLCLGALGSDTGGSVRIPAAVCGVAGLKPTYGRVPKSGTAALSWSLDHVGPLARTVGDIAAVLQVIAGPDPSDPTTLPGPVPDFTAALDGGVSGLRLGVPEAHAREGAHPEVVQAFGAALGVLSDLGADIIPISIPVLDHTLAIEFNIVAAEASTYHRRLLRDRPDDIDAAIRTLLVSGALMPASLYLRATQARQRFVEAVRDVFAAERLVAVLTPTLPAPAVGRDWSELDFGEREDVTAAFVRTTAPWNLTGQPALSVPCGFSSDGLPVGLQIVARPLEEAVALRIGAAFESATEWHQRRPPWHADAA